MTCRELEPLYDELLDGTLDDRRASAARGHLRTCEACARRFEETRALVEAAASLEPRDPPPTLWAAIDARLAAAEVEDARRPRLWWWWQAWKRPAALGFAAACAIAVVAGSWALRDRRSGSAHAPEPAATGVHPEPAPPAPPAPPADDLYAAALHEVDRVDADYTRAIGQLKTIVGAERARWRPEVARAFDENLAAIDAAVERQREVARGAPGDVMALDALHASYRREIDFLQEAVVRGGVTP